MGDQQQRALEAPAARPRAPRGSRGRGGWSARRGSARWRPSATRIASDSRRRSPPESPSSGFSASSPQNRNWPSSARASLGVSPVARWAASSTVRALAPSSSACWESRPSLTLWPRRSLPPSSSRSPASAVISVVLPEPLGPTSETCSPRSSHSSASSSSVALADPQLAVLDLEHHAAGALGRLEREAERLAVARVARRCRSILSSFFGARLRLARAGAGAEAGRRSARAARSRPPASRSRGRARARAPPSPCARRARCP